MKEKRFSSPAMGRLKNGDFMDGEKEKEMNDGRGEEEEEVRVVAEGGGGVRWGASLPYRRPGRDTSSRGLAADTCVLASDTCLCN